MKPVDRVVDVREVASWQDLADLIDSSQIRTFELSARRSDADGNSDFEPLGEGDDQEFTFSAVTEGAPDLYTARLKVSTENTEGSLLVDVGVRYRWDEPVSFSDETEEAFVRNVAFPELYAYARISLIQLAREIGIQSASIAPRPHKLQRQGFTK